MTSERPTVEDLMEHGRMSLTEARRFLLAETLAEKARLTFGPEFVMQQAIKKFSETLTATKEFSR